LSVFALISSTAGLALTRRCLFAELRLRCLGGVIFLTRLYLSLLFLVGHAAQAIGGQALDKLRRVDCGVVAGEWSYACLCCSHLYSTRQKGCSLCSAQDLRIKEYSTPIRHAVDRRGKDGVKIAGGRPSCGRRSAVSSHMNSRLKSLKPYQASRISLFRVPWFRSLHRAACL
jgi:hypothetical protein